MMGRMFQQLKPGASLWCLLMLLVVSVTGCVSSKSKAGGRAEPEVALPSKNAASTKTGKANGRAKPELRRPAEESNIDWLSEHSFNWKTLDSQVKAVKAGLDRRFIVEGFGPFIIATNLSRQRLEEIKQQTIQASYNAFYKDYFRDRPRYIVTIYLFKNLSDYTYYGRKLFNETRTTPYGYFRSAERVMLINAESGMGTVVHEMSHALINSDFPDVPTWFNEGFAALFEQNRISGGSLLGQSNWRYPILKRAIDTNTVVRLRQLIKTTSDEFYDDEDGYNYAEARYLCYYLQEKGLLQSFYAKFRENYSRDPSGMRILEEVLQKDIDSIEKEWLQWARSLPENPRRVGTASAFRN